MLLDSIDDKYIADAEIKPKSSAKATRENVFWGFFNNAATIAATVIIICGIIVWTLIGKDILKDSQSDNSADETTTTTETVTLERPSGGGFSEMTATDITIGVCERNSTYFYSKIFENESTRDATEIPADKCYYTVACRMETGAASYFHTKKIYDSGDIEIISQLISDAKFEPTDESVRYGVFIERYADTDITESYELDLQYGYLYRKTELGRFEKSTKPLSNDDMCSIALAFFLSQNYEIISSFGDIETDGYAYIFGLYEIGSKNKSFEITLEYAGHTLTLDNETSKSFYNEMLGGDNCKLRRAVTYGKREFIPENCIKYTCKTSTTLYNGSVSVTEEVLYIDANNTVVSDSVNTGEYVRIDSTVNLSATASDDIYITYKAVSFEFEDILSFMEQKLSEQN